MKKQILSLLSMLAVAFALSAPAFSAPKPAPSGAPPQAAGAKQAKGEAGEHHPAIRHAIESLERAKAYMQHANHDFGGHREDALKACDQAIEQLKLALQNDKK